MPRRPDGRSGALARARDAHPGPDAALDLACRGWPLFPLLRGGKAPAIRSAHPAGRTCKGECGQHGHGLHDATTDPTTITRWARLYPGCNWGIATSAAGLVVVDVDTGKGEIPELVLPDQRDDGEATPPGVVDGDDVMAWAAERDHGAWPPATFTVRTPSGGVHYVFRAPTRLEVQSSAGKLGWSVDVRARGGYVVAAGSTSLAGQWTADDTGAPVADLPTWLLLRLIRTGHCPDLALPARQQPTATAPAVVRGRGWARRSYADAAVQGERQRVLNAAQGQRNHTLNRAAYSLGQLVGAGDLEYSDAGRGLLDAAVAAGLDQGEAIKTIRSGLNAGAQNPRRGTA